MRLRRCGTYHAHCSTGIRRLFSHKRCEPLSAVARRHGRSSSAQTSGLAWASGGEWLGTCRLVGNSVQAARYLALHGTATSRRQAVDVRADGGAGLRSLNFLFARWTTWVHVVCPVPATLRQKRCAHGEGDVFRCSRWSRRPPAGQLKWRRLCC